ncbi:MAG: MATE family efflux transporter, partial [Venatoribacter sp.]
MSFSAKEARSLTRLTLPILATQLAQVGMGTIDTLMSGHVSTEDLAAVAIGTSVWMPVWLFVSGVLVALSPLASALNAGQRRDELPKLLGAGIYSGILLGIAAALLLLGASFVLESFIDDEKTAFVAANYTRAIAAGMPFGGLFLAYRLYAEALNQPFHVTRIMLFGLAMNVPANGLFIYGWFGLPQLGGIGCGIGSALVFVGMTIALAFNTRKHRIPKGFPLWQHALHPLKSNVRDIFKIGVPIGVAIFFEVSLFVVIALFLTQLGPTVVAGHQVALNLSSLTFMIPLSIAMALTVRVSFWRGKNEPELAKQTSWLGVKINLGLAMINATFMVLFARHIASLYSPDAEVVAIAAG